MFWYSFGSYRLNLFKGRESPQPHTTRQAWAKFFVHPMQLAHRRSLCRKQHIIKTATAKFCAHPLLATKHLGCVRRITPSFFITASSQTPHIYCLRELLVWEPRVLKLSWDQHLGYWHTFCLCESEGREKVKRGDVSLGEFSSSIP